MFIKTLSLRAFGKFKDTKVELKPGLNLVYGTNEAGKTTVQTFIQGMFFGFYKPYRKKKTYSEEYQKYMPWNQFDYSGALTYQINGQEIRLERNFLRAKDSLFIYDNTTGKIINDQFKYDGVIRQHLPLGNLGMTAVIYNHTVNMRQSDQDYDGSSQDEIRDSYLEMHNASGIEINFKGLIRRLEEKKNLIGRSSQSKSRIGAAIATTGSFVRRPTRGLPIAVLPVASTCLKYSMSPNETPSRPTEAGNSARPVPLLSITTIPA